jgi:pyrroloquinoline quinone biosynthesis protein B
MWKVLLLATLTIGCNADAPGSNLAPAVPYIQILGTAQDGGFPHAACSCVRCERARRDPSFGRLISSLAIVLPETGQVYLIDATPDIRAQLDRLAEVRNAPEGRVDRAPVDGVFLTHAHIGHYTGLSFFGFEAVHTDALPVYCTQRMASFLTAHAPWQQLVRLHNIDLNKISEGTVVNLPDGISVEPLRVPHRDEYADTVGFKIRGPNRTVLFIPDTEPYERWARPLEELLTDVDIALLDGSFYSLDELPGRDVSQIGHPLMRDTMDRLAEWNSEHEVRFIHLNHSNPALDADSAEAQEIRARGFSVANDGDLLPL